MPLAVLFGRGASELIKIAGFAPKLDPKFVCTLARVTSMPANANDQRAGNSLITMREIDERGMNACMTKPLMWLRRQAAALRLPDVDALDPGDALAQARSFAAD